MARRCFLLAIALLALFSQWTASASAGPAVTRLAYGTSEIVPIPAAIPHEEGDMVDRRIIPNLRWIAARFPIYVSDGYSGPLPNGERAGCNGCHVKHSDHYNGLAVDITPVNWSDKCDANWRGITRLALWAEPVQNEPAPPFRWVGYDGDSGHGCGHHLHLSWEHAPAKQFELAEWVSVFQVGAQTTPPATTPLPERSKPKSKAAPSQPAPAPGPRGGVATVQSGGVSSRGD
jgi:hypothetical protein